MVFENDENQSNQKSWVIGPNGIKTYYESNKSNEKNNRVYKYEQIKAVKLSLKSLAEDGSLQIKPEANLGGDDSPPSPSVSEESMGKSSDSSAREK